MKAALWKAFLLCGLIGVLAPACDAGNVYPPYPDVWQWIPPKKTDMELVAIGAAVLSNGDVLVSGSYKGPDGLQHDFFRTFFSGRAIDHDKTDFSQGRIVLSDGTVLRENGNSSRAFSDGSRVRIVSNQYRQCYRGPARDYFAVIANGANKYLHQGVFFYLLDRPHEFIGGGGDTWNGEPDASCPDEGPLHLTFRVETLGGAILYLQDDTFLIIDQRHGMVLRVDKALNTRAPLLNDRVFIFDYPGDPFIVTKLLKKDYGLSEDETAEITRRQYQTALDDLYRYLLTLRKGN